MSANFPDSDSDPESSGDEMDYEMESQMSEESGHKREREEDEESPRSPTRRRLSEEKCPSESSSSSFQSRSPTPSTARPSNPAPYPIPSDSSSSSDGVPTPRAPVGRENTPLELNGARVRALREKGAAYQAWISNPSRTGCPVSRCTDTMEGLLNNVVKKQRFKCRETLFVLPPDQIWDDLEKVGLPITKTYRYTTLSCPGHDASGYRRETHYTQSSGEGAFIAEAIFRYGGPHWSSVALAQYRFDHDIDTLRHVYFISVINEVTLPYVQDVLLRRHRLPWALDGEKVSYDWEYDTRGYQEILGTPLGTAVACMVLGAWDRGTHHITRISTIIEDDMLNLRFDIAPSTSAG